MKAPSSAPSLPGPADMLAEVEAMILRLAELRQAAPGKERKADFQAVIDRLHALAYRLERDATPGRVIGLPAPASAKAAPPAPTSAECRTRSRRRRLPLGPVVDSPAGPRGADVLHRRA